MSIAKSLLAAAAVLTFIGSGALAEPQMVQGKIVKMDKASHQVTLQPGTPGQTVGSTAAPIQYRLDHEPSWNNLKVGDQVTFKIDQLNGVPTVVHVEGLLVTK